MGFCGILIFRHGPESMVQGIYAHIWDHGRCFINGGNGMNYAMLRVVLAISSVLQVFGCLFCRHQGSLLVTLLYYENTWCTLWQFNIAIDSMAQSKYWIYPAIRWWFSMFFSMVCSFTGGYQITIFWVVAVVAGSSPNSWQGNTKVVPQFGIAKLGFT